MNSYVIYSYDLHGECNSKERYLDYLTSHGWSDHAHRGDNFERLPNTTLFTHKNLDAAKIDIRAAANKASQNDQDFLVTHWTLGTYTESEGGVRPIPAQTKAAALTQKVADD